MKNKSFPIEVLKQSETNKLIGGFSGIFETPSHDSTAAKVNNCNGGNVKAGCGSHPKNKKKYNNAPNANCQGNCVAGCGQTK